jgi:hypothetical protein
MLHATVPSQFCKGQNFDRFRALKLTSSHLQVRAYVLETIASDPGLQQAELVFLGLFGRACRILDSRDSQVTLTTPQVLRHRRGLRFHGITDVH